MTKALTTSLQVRENDADFSFSASRTGLVFSLLRARTGMLVKLNLILAIFALPAIAAIYLYLNQTMMIGALMPYSADFGVGYPVVSDAAAVGAKLLMQSSMRMHLLMTAGIALLCIALSGAFYVMRNLARGDVFPVVKNYLIGMKRSVVPFLCVAPLLAGLYYLIAGGISAFDVIPMSPPLKIFLLILIGLVTLILIMAAMFFFTQAVTFKMKVSTLLKNSFIFAIRLFVRNLIVLVFTALPFALIFWMLTVSFLSIVSILLALSLLFSFVVMLWTVYAHWAFDKFLNAYAPEGGAVVVETTEAAEAVAAGNTDTAALISAPEAEQTEEADEPVESAGTDAETQAETAAQKSARQAADTKPSNAYKFQKKRK